MTLFRLFKIFWLLSFPAFVAETILVYVYLPDHVLLESGAHGLTGATVGKDDFFYLAIGTLALSNLLLYLFGNLLAYLPAPVLAIPHKAFWLSGLGGRKAFQKLSKGWAKGIMFFVNLLLMVFVYQVYTINAGIGFGLDILYFVLLGALTAWIFILFAVLAKPPGQASAQ